MDASLFSAAADLADLGAYEFDSATYIGTASRRFYEIHGLPPRQSPLSGSEYFQLVHPDDKPGLSAFAVRLRERGQPLAQVTWRIVRPDGKVRRLHATATGVPGTEPVRVVGTVQDVTEQLTGQTGLGLHLAVAEAIRAWQRDGDPITRVLAAVAQALEGTHAALWIRRREGGLSCLHTWASRTEDRKELQRLASGVTLRAGEGLVGRAWERGALRLADERARHPHLSYVQVSEADDRIAFPALDNGRPLAVFEIYMPAAPPLVSPLAETLATVGAELGYVLARHRADLERMAVTQREREVLQLAANGASIADIAEALVVSQSTVKTHLEHIHAKLGVRNRSGAVAEGLRLGIIE